MRLQSLLIAFLPSDLSDLALAIGCLYVFVGSFLATLWFRMVRKAIPHRTTRWRLRGWFIVFAGWPVIVAKDIVQEIGIARRMRAAYRGKGTV